MPPPEPAQPRPSTQRPPAATSSSSSEPTPSSEPPSGTEPAPATEPPAATETPAARGAPPPALHLRPTAELAERVLLPGDPGRALALAQVLIAEPRMFNHYRGLWGYTGPAHADGLPLTIQSTGMGGPSAAIVLSELIALGARHAIRVGTCGALDPGIALGDVVVARESICRDGASSTLLGAGERAAADPDLTDALLAAARDARAGTVVSVDLFYDPHTHGSHRPTGATRERAGDEGAIAVEMEAATLFALGTRTGVAVACILAVSDTFSPDGARTRIDDHALLAVAERMGGAAVTALGHTRRT